MKIAKRAQVAPSATMTINSVALQKKRAGEKVYNFAAGDPAIPHHEKIGVQASHASPYPPAAGIAELREAACSWMNATYQTNYKVENSIVTCGGKFAVYGIPQVLLDPGDEALIIAPYWVSYPGIVQLAGGKAVTISAKEKNGWKVSAEEIRKKITKRTKLLIFNNGNNPTGALYTRGEIIEILTVCKEADVTVLSDEVYSELVYDGHKYVSCGSFPDFQSHVVVVQSCSKNFAMAGIRVGFAFGPKELIKSLIMLQGQSTTGTALQSQQMALSAISHAKEVSAYVRGAMQNRRKLMLDTFSDHFDAEFPAPQSAIYFFLPLKSFGLSLFNSVTFCEKVLEKGNVALVPGIAFGNDDYVRLSFSGNEEDIVNGLSALSGVCNQMKKEL